MNYIDLNLYINNNLLKNGKLIASAVQWGLINNIKNELDFFIKIDCDNVEKLYRYLHQDNNEHYCECGKKLEFINFSKGFKNFCSVSCSRKSVLTQEKYKQTCLNKYGTEFYNNKEKIKQTNLKKLGVEYPLQSKKIQEKIQKNNLQKFGNITPCQYGFKDFKKNLLIKYGILNAMQKREFVIKASINSSNKMKIKEYNSIYGKLYYQTKPELNFIKFCEKNNIFLQNGPILEYTLNNTRHNYHVDFETKNALIEIKEDHIWYKQDIMSGKIQTKNSAAKTWCDKNNKNFLFLLNNKNYKSIKEEL